MLKKIWHKSKIEKAAKAFSSKYQFKKAFPTAYKTACAEGFLQEVCSHMVPCYTYHCLDSVTTLAEKCRSRTEFFRKHGSAYNWAKNKKVLDKVCAHMEPGKAYTDDPVYVYRYLGPLFCYYGVSLKPSKRKYQHLGLDGLVSSSRKIVQEHILSVDQFDIFPWDGNPELMPRSEALLLEKKLINQSGYKSININENNYWKNGMKPENTFTIVKKAGSQCTWCDKAETILLERGHNYIVREMDLTSLKKVARDVNMNTVPIVFIGVTLIGGYDALVKYLNSDRYAVT